MSQFPWESVAIAEYGRRVRALLQPMLWHAFVATVALSLVTLTKVYAIISPELPFFRVLVPVTFAQFGMAFIFIYGFLILTRGLPLRGWTHVAAMCLGAVAGMYIFDHLMSLHSGYPWDAVVRWHVVESEEAFIADAQWVALSTALLALVFYAATDREARVASALREAEYERAVDQRKIMESKLVVVQARVEPEFLFTALANARRLYESAPAVADKLLDDLIAYLRAALPRMRGSASTIDREIELCTAYLGVALSAREGRMTVEAQVDSAARDVTLPPMVLLPLVQAIANAGGSSVALHGELGDAEALIAVSTTADSAPLGWSATSLAPLRETLAHFYGATATLTVARRDQAWFAEIRFPWTRERAAAVPPSGIALLIAGTGRVAG